MAQDLNFLSIPASLLDPGAYGEYDDSRASGALVAAPRKILVIGQRLASSPQPALQPVRIFAPGDGVGQFGQGSMLAAMIAQVRAVNAQSEVWAIACDDNPAGTAAAWAVTVTGNQTSAGTLTLYIGAVPVQVAVPLTMQTGQIATGLAAAINTNADLPVTAAVDPKLTTQVNVTMRWAGPTGNDLDLRTSLNTGDQPPSGLSLTIVQTTEGSANPSLVPVIASLGSRWYTDWAVPYTDAASYALIGQELERRAGSGVGKDGLAYSFVPGSLGALAAFGLSVNGRFQLAAGDYRRPTPSWLVAATMAAICSPRLEADPAAPLTGLSLPGVRAPAEADQYQHQDREMMLHDGISVLTTDGGSGTVIKRLITGYRVNAQGIQSKSYLDPETLASLSYLRHWVRSRIALRWPQYKLVDDPPAGQPLPDGARITCPRLIRQDLVAGAGDLAQQGIITSVADFAKSIIVRKSASDPDSVNAILPYTLVRRFLVFAFQIPFR